MTTGEQGKLDSAVYKPGDKIQVERPSHRNNGKYQFTTGYTGGFAAEMCAHLTFDEIVERCREKFGPGSLADDGVDLWWTLE